MELCGKVKTPKPVVSKIPSLLDDLFRLLTDWLRLHRGRKCIFNSFSKTIFEYSVYKYKNSQRTQIFTQNCPFQQPKRFESTSSTSNAFIYTARPRDTRPQGARTLEIHGF